MPLCCRDFDKAAQDKFKCAIAEVLTLLALLAQKYKYWRASVQMRHRWGAHFTCFAGTKVLQQYKYWRAPAYPRSSLLALLAQKYKYWRAPACLI
jgi:hypothetical protein